MGRIQKFYWIVVKILDLDLFTDVHMEGCKKGLVVVSLYLLRFLLVLDAFFKSKRREICRICVASRSVSDGDGY